MGGLTLIVLGFAPGVFWLWLIYQRDRYIPAPVNLVVRTFLWGIAVSVPVVLVEGGLSTVGGIDLGRTLEPDGGSPGQAAYVAFVVAGMTEELAKYLVVRKTIFDSLYFRQPLDGIIFMAAAALGFASLENIGYMLAYGSQVILLRGPISTLAHVLFSAIWGYTLGAQKRSLVGRYVVTIALLTSMVLHGIFDFFLLADPDYWIWSLALFLGMAAMFVLLIQVARYQSPYRNKVAAILKTCPACGQRTGHGARFCPECGQPFPGAKAAATLLCSQCGGILGPGHAFCTTCGSRLDRKLVPPPQAGNAV